MVVLPEPEGAEKMMSLPDSMHKDRNLKVHYKMNITAMIMMMIMATYCQTSTKYG